MQVIIIVILILAVLLVIFTLQNSMDITLNVFFWEINNAPLVLILLACILIGYLISAVYFYPRLWKVKREYNQLIKFNSELKEFHNLQHKKKEVVTEEETNPEGILMEDDADDNSFFKD